MGEAELQPEELRRTGLTFRQEADAFSGAVDRFESRATAVDDAFGVMMESTEALQRYVDMATDTVEGLRTLQRVLAGFGVRLDESADDWERADARAGAALDALMATLQSLDGAPGRASLADDGAGDSPPPREVPEPPVDPGAGTPPPPDGAAPAPPGGDAPPSGGVGTYDVGGGGAR